MQNSEIFAHLKQLQQALADTIQQAEKGSNTAFYKESIKHTALHIFEQSQLLDTNTQVAKTTPAIKIIKQQEPLIEEKIIEPKVEKIEPLPEKAIEAKPIVAEVKAEPIEIKIEKPEILEPPKIEKPIVQEIKPTQQHYVHPSEELDENDNSLNAKLAKNKIPVQNVADKLSAVPIKELTKAIAISKKFELIKELFYNNADAYKAALENIEQCSSHAQAKELLENQAANNPKWQENEDLVSEFSELVRRRFL